MNWAEFFSMGGYAFYVWSSYGLTLVILLANIIIPVWNKRTVLKQLRDINATTDQESK